LGSESETCVGSRVHLVGVSISFEKNFYRLPFTPPLSGSPYRSFTLITALAYFEGVLGWMIVDIIHISYLQVRARLGPSP
jgi:hypothetical protein